MARRTIGGGPRDNELPQIDKFVESARQLECDEDEKAFEDKVRKVANAPKPPHEPNTDGAQ